MSNKDDLNRDALDGEDRPRLTLEEWLEQVRQFKPIQTDKTAAQIIREIRDADDHK